MTVRAALGLVLVAIVAAAPWLAYGAGLLNLDGRPEPPPRAERLSVAEQEVVRIALRKSGALVVPELSPWGWAASLVVDPEELRRPGVAAARAAAEAWTAGHLRLRHPWMRRTSSVALTIWLTRNWTTEQILREAYEVLSRRGGGAAGGPPARAADNRGAA